MSQDPTAVSSTHRWPCEQCGAQLRFAPGQTELVCAHCGHKQLIPQADSGNLDQALQEHNLQLGLRDALPLDAMETVRTTQCSNCGALIEFNGATHAKECPFCASPIVVDTGNTRQIKPQALVPFVYSERQAHDQLTKWLGSLWFAPSKLLEYTRKGRAMNGVYVPYWTFDAQTQSHYRGQRGDVYYETETVTINGKQETRQKRRIRWSYVSGRVARDFDDMLVMGSTALPRNYADALEPWHLSDLVPYTPDYLAGFTAEGYSIALPDADTISKEKMDRIIRQDVRHDIGGDEQKIDQLSTDHFGETFKHILLPIWMAAYKYNGKSYRFLVNGQTGEVQGERPWSAWKITFAVIAALIAAGLVYYVSEMR